MRSGSETERGNAYKGWVDDPQRDPWVPSGGLDRTYSRVGVMKGEEAGSLNPRTVIFSD